MPMTNANAHPTQGQDWLDQVAWNRDGLVAAVAQDAGSGRVLMQAWMNPAALAETVARGYATYWSRSRGRLWRKGEESGHSQRVTSVRLDCDGDAVLLEVEQSGGIACHTGRESCFYRKLSGGRWRITDAVAKDPEQNMEAGPDVLARLSAVLERRRAAAPDQSYVARLYAQGDEAILAKITEEAQEVVGAARSDDDAHLIHEIADLWFHSMVLLGKRRLAADDVLAELAGRFGVSGLDEKAARPLKTARQTAR